MKPRIGLGIVTYNRPDYLRQCMTGVMTHLLPFASHIAICNDGSDPQHKRVYDQIYSELPLEITIFDQKENKGVAHAKNTVLRHLMDKGCEYLFILEDDVIPDSPMAFEGYINAHKASGIHHMMFAHHGNGNPASFAIRGLVAYYPNCVGAYCFYTRKAIETIGYFDEHFKNAWEHVEHTFRLANAGLTSQFWAFADASDSRNWLHEIPGSIDHSTREIDLEKNVTAGMEYWRKKDGGPPPRPWSITL